MSDNLIGKVLANRYEIKELIGLGGMAGVYRAHCNLLKRDVAIKILKDDARHDPMVLKSFQSEAQASAGLSDTNIVQIYDVGEEDGIDYIVMELVQGITLKQYIKNNGPIDWHVALDYASQMCKALSVAHGSGVIHRDIKPQNIMVTDDAIIKVTDFGIARAQASAEGGTINTNDAMGSVHYISPEQARGGFVDYKSDIYSLGVVMYEMLTGKVPFDNKNSMAIAVMHIEQEATPVNDVNPRVPLAVARIVAKAMAKESATRYSSVVDLDADIKAVLDADKNGTVFVEEDDNTSTKKIDTDGVNDYIDNDDDDDDSYYNDDVTTDRIVVSGDAITEAGAKPSDSSMGPRVSTNAGVDDYFDDYDPYEEDDDDDEPVDRISRKSTKRKRVRHERTPEEKDADKRATILAIATVVVVALIIYGVYYFMMKRGDKIHFANYSGMTVEEVSDKLATKNIEVIEERSEFSDTVKEGVIISQNPKEGWAKNTGALYVVTSKGPSGGEHEVPNIVGMSIDDAQMAILDADMAYEFIEDPTITEGEDINSAQSIEDVKIVATSPAAGTKLKVISEVGQDDEVDTYTVFIMVNCSGSRLAELLGSDGGQNAIAIPAVTPVPSGPKEISLTVPSDGDTTGMFKVEIDGDVVYNVEKVQGDEVKITLSGSGDHLVEAYFDEEKCYSETIQVN